MVCYSFRFVDSSGCYSHACAGAARAEHRKALAKQKNLVAKTFEALQLGLLLA
jgi:hypothetical protein